MLQCCHGVNLLDETLLQLRVFDHLLLGKTLDGIEGGGRCGFGGKQNMSEAPFANLPDAVELVRV